MTMTKTNALRRSVSTTLKHEECVLVFTYQDLNTLLQFNGSQSWRLQTGGRDRVRKCLYIICVNNAKHKLSQNFDNHGGAFLVGRISGVSKALESNFEDRSIIEFDEYAEINIPKIWEGWRNPVIYLKTVSLNTVGAIAGKLNIDFDNLEFHKVPPRDTQFIVNHMNVENKKLEERNKI